MCLAVLSATAKTSFRTVELERLAKVLAIDADQVPDGYSHPTANGLSLTVHQTEQTIDHIGLYLFTEEMRQMGKSPVFDFLERYFLQLKYPPRAKSMSNMIRDDEFRFLMGNLGTVDSLRLTDEFSFNYDNRCYQAVWKRNGTVQLSVSFPVEYELISGENKTEAEDNLPADIRSTSIVIPTGKPVVRKDHYLLESITNRLYLSKGQLVSSVRHPAESAANIMLSLQTEGDYHIRITQVSYGFKKKVFEVPLKQWIAFCQSHGCELYFGIQNLSDSGDVDGVVMAVNAAENYNHVLTVHIPIEAVEGKCGTVEARLYPYVPTHNVLDMFATYKKSNSQKIVSK